MTQPDSSRAELRPFNGPVLLRDGFRPFFLAAGLWSALAMALWLPVLDGRIALQTAFDPVAWHVHEMLFGFVAAAIAGFLLTAIPNWTGRMPLQGTPLAVLVAAWVLGRVAVATGGVIGPAAAAFCDLAFLVLLLSAVIREILAGRNWRNLPMPAAVAALLAGNALMHAEALDWVAAGGLGQRLGIAVVALLIGLVGGRVVPSFTRNWLVKRGAPATPSPFGAFDKMALLLLFAGLAFWTVQPDTRWTGVGLLASGTVTALRLLRWSGHRTSQEPLVWSLHAGFAWLPVGLMLLAAGILWPYAVPASAGIHALTAGAFGSMTLAVMTRATLGHSGRPLVADGWTAALYGLAAAAAAARVAAAWDLELQGMLLALSATAWIAAFGLFTIRYGMILLSR